jgi:hypothetical protein
MARTLTWGDLPAPTCHISGISTRRLWGLLRRSKHTSTLAADCRDPSTYRVGVIHDGSRILANDGKDLCLLRAAARI